MIDERLTKRETVMSIREALLNMKIQYDMIDKALIETVKLRQLRQVEELKKAGKFVPDMTPEQLKAHSAFRTKAKAGAAATDAGVKKEEPKKGKK